MVVTVVLTFAVSVVINLDFGSSEAGVSMQLTVVEVGLAVAAAHRPLVRFALLKQTQAGGLWSRGANARIRACTHAHVQLVGTPWQGASALASVTLPHSTLEAPRHFAALHGPLC